MAIKERWKGFVELPADIEQKAEHLPALFEKHGVQLAYLFGSLSSGSEANDVDLAVWVSDVPAYRLRDPVVECLGTDWTSIGTSPGKSLPRVSASVGSLSEA